MHSPVSPSLTVFPGVPTLQADSLPLGQEDPLEEGMATTPVFLPGEPHGQRRLAGYSP